MAAVFFLIVYRVSMFKIRMIRNLIIVILGYPTVNNFADGCIDAIYKNVYLLILYKLNSY